MAPREVTPCALGSSEEGIGEIRSRVLSSLELDPCPEVGNSALASPKSSTFACPEGVTMMLEDLMSRWRIPS